MTSQSRNASPEDGKSTYTDYIFRTANTAFVVEAKKVGTTFESVGDNRKARLSGRLLEGRTGKAIKQARGLLQKEVNPICRCNKRSSMADLSWRSNGPSEFFPIQCANFRHTNPCVRGGVR